MACPTDCDEDIAEPIFSERTSKISPTLQRQRSLVILTGKADVKTPSNSFSNQCFHPMFQILRVILNNWFIIQLQDWEMFCNSVFVFFHPEPVLNKDGEICTVKTQEILEGNGSEGECRGSRKCGVSLHIHIFKPCLAAMKNHKHFTP